MKSEDLFSSSQVTPALNSPCFTQMPPSRRYLPCPSALKWHLPPPTPPSFNCFPRYTFLHKDLWFDLHICFLLLSFHPTPIHCIFHESLDYMFSLLVFSKSLELNRCSVETCWIFLMAIFMTDIKATCLFLHYFLKHYYLKWF